MVSFAHAIAPSSPLFLRPVNSWQCWMSGPRDSSVVKLFTCHSAVTEGEKNVESRLGRSWFGLLYSIFLHEINYWSIEKEREMAKDLRTYLLLYTVSSSDECSLIWCWCSHRMANKAKAPSGQCQLHCRVLYLLAFAHLSATFILIWSRHFSSESPQHFNLLISWVDFLVFSLLPLVVGEFTYQLIKTRDMLEALCFQGKDFAVKQFFFPRIFLAVHIAHKNDQSKSLETSSKSISKKMERRKIFFLRLFKLSQVILEEKMIWILCKYVFSRTLFYLHQIIESGKRTRNL